MNARAQADRRLRICVASSGLGHVARGIEAWAADLGRALVERGEDVLLCKGGGEAHEKYERVVPCWTRESAATRRLRRWLPRFLGWRVGLGGAYPVEQTSFAWKLLKVLRREQIEILHVQDPLVALHVQRARRWGWVRARTILAHGTEEPFDFQRRIVYLQHLAPWHLEEARRAGVERSCWTAIPNFIDTETFRPNREPAGTREDGGLRDELGLPADAVVALSAAAIKRRHKRVDYVLEEFAALLQSQPELPLYLVLAGGWEPDTDELMAQGQARLGDRVRFLVRFPRQRMPELYRTADLFLLGSLKEMMPIALLEAASSGLPCLVNAHPVMQWMIGPGGLAGEWERSGALQTALSQLVPDHSRRYQLGQQARGHCLEHFSRDRVIDQILAYYRVVADDSGQEGAGT